MNEAYKVLSDADSRKKYDAYGDQWKDADRIESSVALRGLLRLAVRLRDLWQV